MCGGMHPPPQMFCQYSAPGCSTDVSKQSGGSGVYASGNSTPKIPGHGSARVNRAGRERVSNGGGKGLKEDHEGLRKRPVAPGSRRSRALRALTSCEASRPGSTTRFSRVIFDIFPRQFLSRLISSLLPRFSPDHLNSGCVGISRMARTNAARFSHRSTTSRWHFRRANITARKTRSCCYARTRGYHVNWR